MEADKRVQKALETAKAGWIGTQCEEIVTCLNRNNRKRTHQPVKNLTSDKQGKSIPIQAKSRFCCCYVLLSSTHREHKNIL